jgi:antitoxin MazE
MRAVIQKWGNSLALRIPKTFSKELGIDESTPVEMRVEKSTLIIKPKKNKKKTLKELLEMINKNNRHEAIETGPVVGKEVW